MTAIVHNAEIGPILPGDIALRGFEWTGAERIDLTIALVVGNRPFGALRFVRATEVVIELR